MDSTFFLPMDAQAAITRIVSETDAVSRWLFSDRRFVPRRGAREYVCAAEADRLRLRRRSAANLVHNLYAITSVTFAPRPDGTQVALSTRSRIRPWMFAAFGVVALVFSFTVTGVTATGRLLFALLPVSILAVMVLLSRAVERSDRQHVKAWFASLFPEAIEVASLTMPGSTF